MGGWRPSTGRWFSSWDERETRRDSKYSTMPEAVDISRCLLYIIIQCLSSVLHRHQCDYNIDWPFYSNAVVVIVTNFLDVLPIVIVQWHRWWARAARVASIYSYHRVTDVTTCMCTCVCPHSQSPSLYLSQYVCVCVCDKDTHARAHTHIHSQSVTQSSSQSSNIIRDKKQSHQAVSAHHTHTHTEREDVIKNTPCQSTSSHTPPKPEQRVSATIVQ